MSKILSQNEFEPKSLNEEGREMECQEWMDGFAAIEMQMQEIPVFCFVTAPGFVKVTLLRFRSEEDRDETMGYLEPAFVGGEKVYYPVEG